MYISDLQPFLQKLIPTERITQEKIGLALGVGKGTISARVKSHSRLRDDEKHKIEEYFKVKLQAIDNKINLSDALLFLKEQYKIDDDLCVYITELLENRSMLLGVYLYVACVKGDTNALSILKMINENPDTLELMFRGK